MSNITMAKHWMATRSFVTPSLGWNVMTYSGVFDANRYWWTGPSQTCGYLSTNFPTTNGCINHGGMDFWASSGRVQFGGGRTSNLDVGVGVGTGAVMTQGSLSQYPDLIPTRVAGRARVNPYGINNGWTMPSATTPQTFPVYTPIRSQAYVDGVLGPRESITFTQLLTPESTRSQAYGSIANCNNTNDTFEGVIVLGNVCV